MSYPKTEDGRPFDPAIMKAAGRSPLTLHGLCRALGAIADANTYTLAERVSLEELARGESTPGAAAVLRAFLRAFHPADFQRMRPGKKAPPAEQLELG